MRDRIVSVNLCFGHSYIVHKYSSKDQAYFDDSIAVFKGYISIYGISTRMNCFDAQAASLALGASNDLSSIKYELLAGVEAVQGCHLGHEVIVYRRFVLYSSCFEGFTSFSSIFGVAVFAWKSVFQPSPCGPGVWSLCFSPG